MMTWGDFKKDLFSNGDILGFNVDESIFNFKYIDDNNNKLDYPLLELYFNHKKIKAISFLNKKEINNQCSKLIPGQMFFINSYFIDKLNKFIENNKAKLNSVELNIFLENLVKFPEKSLSMNYNIHSISILEEFAYSLTHTELIELIDYNLKKHELILKKYNSFINININNNKITWLNDFIKLDHKQLNLLNILIKEFSQSSMNGLASTSFQFAISSMRSMNSFNTMSMIFLYAYVYDFEEKDFIELISNKKLQQIGVIKKDVEDFLHENSVNEYNGNLFTLFLNENFVEILKESFHTKESFLKKFIQVERTIDTELTLSNYDYISSSINDIINSIKSSKKPLDILFWGLPGTGKTDLAKVITKELNYKLCKIDDYDCKHRDKFFENQRMYQLTMAKNFSEILDNYIILVDEAEQILCNSDAKHIVTSELENKKINTIWIVNNIENIHPAYLRRFDYIQEIKNMPFMSRYKLAKNLLNNNHDDLSYKIAQAMHNPAEIISAINWCNNSNKFNWKHVQNKMNSYQKVLNQTVKDSVYDFNIEIISPELDNNKGLSQFAGYDYLHQEANKIKDIFNQPEKYQNMGAKIPKGILLAGDSGVGKTLFARSLANEIAIPLIKADCSVLASKMGAIAELFNQARNQAPCIVFLDEIDVIASNVMSMAGPDTEKQKILNQLLIQMDGFEPLEGVLVIGATHRAELLDPSVKRSGRFGQTLYIRTPSQKDRIDIWKYYSNKVEKENDINYETLAKLSSGMSAADIAESVNIAAMNAVLAQKTKINQFIFEEACNKVFWGCDANGLPIKNSEQWKTAIHEAGHALIAIKNNHPISRITIRPHMNFLGAVGLEQQEGVYSTDLSQIKQKTEIFLGGLVAEKLLFEQHGSGVASDLQQASSYLYNALMRYGMSETMSMTVLTVNTPGISQKRLEKIEEEQEKILESAKDSVEKYLITNKDLLLNLAKLLIEKRSCSQTEIYEWLKQQKMTSTKEFVDYSLEHLMELSFKGNKLLY